MEPASVGLGANWVWWNLPLPELIVPPLSSLIETEPTGVKWNSTAETERLLSMMSKTNLAKFREAQQAGVRRVGTIYRRTRPIIEHGTITGKQQRAEVRFDGISGCLRTPSGGSSRQTGLVVEGAQVRSRLISPREAARLMGVPENYPLPSRYNDAYQLFGDGVVVPVVAWLDRFLLKPLLPR
jgi:DNA (cytosine-5)-methyltransferase 1